MKKLTAIALAALAITAMGVAGNADFEDAKASEAAYCERVASGAHSDYLNISEVCNDRH
jgi:hypothetical protein